MFEMILEWLLVAITLIAGVLNIKKKVLCFYLWGAADISYTGLFLYQGNYPMVTFFSFYTLLAIYGAYSWTKNKP